MENVPPNPRHISEAIPLSDFVNQAPIGDDPAADRYFLGAPFLGGLGLGTRLDILGYQTTIFEHPRWVPGP